MLHFSNRFYQAVANPTIAANKRLPAVNEIASLEGTVEAPSASDVLSPVGESSLEVAVGLPVLRVMEEEPVLVDMLVFVDAPVVVIDEASVVLEESSLLMEAALVSAAELGEEETDLTVFFDSTTNCAE